MDCKKALAETEKEAKKKAEEAQKGAQDAEYVEVTEEPLSFYKIPHN